MISRRDALKLGAAGLVAPSLALTTANATSVLAQDSGGSVPMYRGNASRTGEMPGPGPDPAKPIVEKWRFESRSRIYASPIVFDGTVYVGTFYGRLYALDAESGKERWTLEKEDVFTSTPAYEDGTLYVGNGTDLLAIDADSGNERWTFPTGDYVDSSPAVVDGIAYIGSRDTNLYAVDVQSGQERWRFDTGGSLLRPMSPAVANGLVFVEGVQSGSPVLFAIDAGSGSVIWDHLLDRYSESSPAVKNGVVYFGNLGPSGGNGSLSAINAETGEELWKIYLNPGPPSSPAISDGVVYISFFSSFYSIEAASGMEIGRFESDRWISTSPVVVDDVVYFGTTDTNLYALDTGSGQVHWNFAASNEIHSTPFVIDETLYFGDHDGNIYAVGN